MYSRRHCLMRTRASARLENECMLRHSSRNFPLKLSLVALCQGFPGAMKALLTPERLSQPSTASETNSGPLAERSTACRQRCPAVEASRKRIADECVARSVRAPLARHQVIFVIDEPQVVRPKSHVVDNAIILQQGRPDDLVLHMSNHFTAIELERRRAQHPESLVTLRERTVLASGDLDNYETQRSRSEQKRG